jgi:hypothetical protein
MIQFIENGPEFGTRPIAVGRNLSGMLECTGSKTPFPKWELFETIVREV